MHELETKTDEPAGQVVPEVEPTDEAGAIRAWKEN